MLAVSAFLLLRQLRFFRSADRRSLGDPSSWGFGLALALALLALELPVLGLLCATVGCSNRWRRC